MKNDIKSIVIDVLETIIISAIIVFIIMQFVFISVREFGTVGPRRKNEKGE